MMLDTVNGNNMGREEHSDDGGEEEDDMSEVEEFSRKRLRLEKVNGGFARSYTKSRQDWTMMQVGKELVNKPMNRVYIKEEYLRGVLEFMLSSEIIETLSWGS